MALSDFFSTIKPKVVTASRVVGIDIGSSSIKVVELENRDGVITLTTYGELELGPYSEDKPVGQSVILDATVERQALVDILRESAVKSRSAVLAMPLSASFVTTMSLSASSEEDITPRVRVEARKYIPVPIAEVTLDWAEIESSENDKKTKRDILLAAIQNEALKRLNTLMQTVEFGKPPIEIECFSTIRSLYSDENPNFVVIDVGAISTKLYIVEGGLLQRMYRVRAGGSLFTEKIATDLQMSFVDAEALKRNITYDDPHFTDIQKAHQVYFSRVLKEFRQIIESFEKSVGTKMDTVYMVGGASTFMGFDKYVSTVFDRTISESKPFNKVAYPAFMEDTMNSIGATFSTALGAALRTFE